MIESEMPDRQKYQDSLSEIRAFYDAYYLLIEEGAVTDWPSFFGDPAYYSVQSASGRSANSRICDSFCDNKAMIIDRATAINATSLYEKRTLRHFLGTLKIISSEQEKFHTETSYLAIESVVDEPPAIFSVGKTYDVITRQNGKMLFERREVVYDHSSIRNSLVFPL